MSFRPFTGMFLRTILTARRSPSPLLRAVITAPTLLRLPPPSPRRWNSSAPPTPPNSESLTAPPSPPKKQQPSYRLTFTCRPCQARSTHTISKQAYHGGSVLVQCPGCKSRHVIADHLKIFGDTYRSLEDILAENGEVLKKARLLKNGDVEFLEEDVGHLLPPEEERL